MKVALVVHGMGEQRRHATLLGLVRPVLEVIETRGDPSKPRSVSGDLSHVQISYGDQTWRFMEYWWADAFERPGRLRVAHWIAHRLTVHLASLRQGMAHALQDVFRPDPNVRDPWVARVYHAIAAPCYWVALRIVWLITPALALVVLPLLSLLALAPFAPPVTRWVHGLLQGLAVDYLGDIHVYFNDRMQAERICGGLHRVLEELGEDPDVTKVVLFAHSTGAVIAYEALAQLSQATTPRAASAVAKVRSLITVGAILNMAWDPSIVRHSRFRQPIPAWIRWYNLWTRYDYGAAGAVFPSGKPWLASVSLVDRRASNYEDLLTDHTGYWQNREQVTTLLLEELGGLDKDNDFWRGQGRRDPADWRSRSAQAWRDYDARRGACGWLAVASLPWLVAGFLLAPPLAVVWGVATGIAEVLGANAGPVDQIAQAAWWALRASVVAALAFFIVYWVYRWTAWGWWERRQRSQRDAEFRRWRDQQTASPT